MYHNLRIYGFDYFWGVTWFLRHPKLKRVFRMSPGYIHDRKLAEKNCNEDIFCNIFVVFGSHKCRVDHPRSMRWLPIRHQGDEWFLYELPGIEPVHLHIVFLTNSYSPVRVSWLSYLSRFVLLLIDQKPIAKFCALTWQTNAWMAWKYLVQKTFPANSSTSIRNRLLLRSSMTENVWEELLPILSFLLNALRWDLNQVYLINWS